jgi:hypothetical protein
MEKIKVIFLDVDGVLNLQRTLSPWSLNKACLKRLKNIIDRTDCKLVLSSTWRKFPKAVHKLNWAGLSFYGYTDQDGPYRGFEIQRFLDAHPEIEEYVILDDDGDMLDSQLRHFVQTTMEYGLSDTLAYRAEYILKTGPWHLNGDYQKETSGSEEPQ